jgi:CubicO group peptidase (beta-lactamase class C family)/D-alanyl-D-alanine dipeptidase
MNLDLRATAGWLLVLGLTVGCGSETERVDPTRAYSPVAAALETYIDHQMREKEIAGLSIALVDGQETVWARGFGYADPVDSVPATARTVFRVGSVSKLFTDIGIMQLVERGELDLDAPITRYLPEFTPANRYGKPITLRQLMSHHSGLVREPPVGNYFDPSEPSLAQTVASLNETELVYEPESRRKYSNAAIATVGYVLERTQGERFATYLERSVLQPLGMTQSSFELAPEYVGQLARAYMWSYDGRVFDAPGFQLGMAPAGSMYSTVGDLAEFMSALFRSSPQSDGQILLAATLEQMWTPQYAAEGRTTGSGIGFAISQLNGRRAVGHGGAIYGFATQLTMLPDEGLGAVVVATKDVANSVVERIADAALRGMLAVREGSSDIHSDTTGPLPDGLANRLAGRYGTGERAVVLEQHDGRLYAFPSRGGFRAELRAMGNGLVVDDVLAWGTRIVPLEDAIVVNGSDTLRRADQPRPDPALQRWGGLMGEYGWDHNTLYVLEKDGLLQVLVEWFFLYPLEELARDTFAFPRWGLYDGEKVIFERNRSGRATRVTAAGVSFERRAVGTEGDDTYRIDPLQPVEQLREVALAAQPPVERGEFRESDLVELVRLDPYFELDIRYATTNNFMSAVFYREPRAFLQRPAAVALARAHSKLRSLGYGLLIHDAYRPWYVTKMFWDATPAEQRIFVANPASGSRHNRGCAVDLTLFDLTSGSPVQMVGGYDEFSDRSFAQYPGGTALQRWHRELLRRVMEEEGFRVYPYEWWHFDYRDWSQYAIQNETFEELGTEGGGT